MTEHPPDLAPALEPTPEQPSKATNVLLVFLVLVMAFALVVGLLVTSWLSSLQGRNL